MKIFCDRLKETRGSTSQKAFASSLGLNQQTYQRYESGVREPDLEHLHRIGVTCGVSIDWLLGLPDRQNSVTANGAGSIATGNHSNVMVKTITHAGSADCLNCKYKRLADAFKAL